MLNHPSNCLYTLLSHPNTVWRTQFGHSHDFNRLILETYKSTSKESIPIGAHVQYVKNPFVLAS